MNLSTGREAGIYTEIKAPAWHRAEGQDISKVALGVLADYGYADPDDLFFLQCFDWNETRRIRAELGWRGKLIQLLGENDWGEAPDVDYDALRTRDGLTAIAKVADGIGPSHARRCDRRRCRRPAARDRSGRQRPCPGTGGAPLHVSRRRAAGLRFQPGGRVSHLPGRRRR